MLGNRLSLMSPNRLSIFGSPLGRSAHQPTTASQSSANDILFREGFQQPLCCVRLLGHYFPPSVLTFWSMFLSEAEIMLGYQSRSRYFLFLRRLHGSQAEAIFSVNILLNGRQFGGLPSW